MKTTGKGFSYYLNDNLLKDFDYFEKKIKNIEVVIDVNPKTL